MTNDYQNKQMQNAQAIFKAQCAARKEANRIEDAKTETFKAMKLRSVVAVNGVTYLY